MLTRFDEYLIHQTPEPLAHPVSMDRNFYDRYWLSGFPSDASFQFGMGLGLYPNRQVMDAAFSFVRGGEQVSCFASRRAHPAAREDTRVGPIRIEVIDPMRTLRLVIAPNESGLEGDLIYCARSACLEEDRQMLRRGHTTQMDVTRFTQFGCWEGELRVDGERIVLNPAQVHGIRDRSWGRRAVGEAEGGAPEPPREIFFLWAPLFWKTEATVAVFFENSQGHALHAEAKAIALHNSTDSFSCIEATGMRLFNGATHREVNGAGTRFAQSGSLKLLQADGSLREIQLEPVLRFQMKGAGYNHPLWKHGNWRGEEACGAERWRLDALDPLAPENLHIQQLVRCTDGAQQGLGVLEQLCIGPHAPSGFKEGLDGAR
jgi:hypothetical protein